MPTIPGPELTKWRIAKTRNEAEYIELKTPILAGNHLDRQKLELAMREICLAIKEIVMGSRQLSREEKLELLQKLAAIPVKAPAQEPRRRPGRPRKQKVEQAATTMLVTTNGTGQ
jgi:hypothetical protein